MPRRILCTLLVSVSLLLSASLSLHAQSTFGTVIGSVTDSSGAAIPGDMAVTGFDDIYASRVVTPQLTTVGQPFRELGHRAAHRLRARIEDRELPAHTEILPTRCVIRVSCGCPAPGGR